ncbi:MAG: FecR domain-containing protein [Spirochaetia bacterium]|nr:FecR domain-containing protein [Spirochaetia bacterium]
MIKIKKLIFTILAAIVFVISCSEKPKIPQQGVFTFVKGTVLHNDQPAKVGNIVGEADTIVTNEKSGAVIQFENSGLITLKSKTKLDVGKLIKGEDGLSIIELTQESGSTFSKIAPNRGKYSIKTPTAVAGVRGTSFSVEVHEDKKTDIKLLKGKVAVSKTSMKAVVQEEASQEIILEEGEKIAATAKGIEKKESLVDEEKKELSSLNKIAMVSVIKLKDTNEIGKATEQNITQEVENQILGEAYQESKKPIEPEVEKKNLNIRKITLDDLRKEFKKLSVINTKSGKKYIGGFKQVGGEMHIKTVDGTVKVPVGDIKKVSEYK